MSFCEAIGNRPVIDPNGAKVGVTVTELVGVDNTWPDGVGVASI